MLDVLQSADVLTFHKTSLEMQVICASYEDIAEAAFPARLGQRAELTTNWQKRDKTVEC